EGGVRALHVCRVVLVVVELEDLGGVMRLEGGVVVRQIGECVLGHRVLLRRRMRSGKAFPVSNLMPRSGIPQTPVAPAGGGPTRAVPGQGAALHSRRLAD